jgi:hypothetical protein
MNRKLFVLICLLVCVSALTISQVNSVAKVSTRAAQGRTITGTVVGISGRYAGRSSPFRLIVNRYTTPEEIQQLTSAMQSGQDELLKTLSHMDAGRISISNNVGVTANAIIRTQQENGTKLTVLYQRNINFYELRYGTRSEDYKFGYAEMFFNRAGRGEGTFIPAAKVRLRDGNTWEVEDFGVFPARLMGLQVRGGSREG